MHFFLVWPCLRRELKLVATKMDNFLEIIQTTTNSILNNVQLIDSLSDPLWPTLFKVLLVEPLSFFTCQGPLCPPQVTFLKSPRQQKITFIEGQKIIFAFNKVFLLTRLLSTGTPTATWPNQQLLSTRRYRSYFSELQLCKLLVAQSTQHQQLLQGTSSSLVHQPSNVQYSMIWSQEDIFGRREAPVKFTQRFLGIAHLEGERGVVSQRLPGWFRATF